MEKIRKFYASTHKLIDMHNDLVDNYLILIIKEIKNKEAYI
jgi:hypothetical protein